MTDKSIFDSSNDNVDNQTTNDNDVDYEAYVASKFKAEDGKVDWKAVARGKYEADQHIAKVERDAAALRDELKTKSSIEQFVELINSKRQDVSSQPPTSASQSPPSVDTHSLSADQVTKMVEDLYSKHQSKQVQEANLEASMRQLVDAWGSNYVSKLQAKARELGVEPAFIDNVARKSPTALASLLGLGNKNTTVDNSYVAPRSEVRTQPSNITNSGVRNYKYWQQLRKSNPDEYWSVKSTRERDKAAIDMGPKFYE